MLENQNVTLKQEIAKLEKQKKHLVGILSGHEGSCAIKKPRLMSSSPPPPGGDQDPPPFRVPLPPIVVSQDPSGGNPPSSSSSNQQQQQHSLSRFDPGFNEQQLYQQQQQQLDIKSELESPTDPTSNNASGWTSCGFDQQQQLQQQQQQLLQQQQGGNGDRDDQSDNFLAKRSLGYTYLDLDSRCIAL